VRKNGPEQLLPGLNYSQNQLFFINFGQIWCGKYRDQSLITRILNLEHPPGEFRIIGSTSNFDEFGKAFKCRLGQPNNPVNKCSVW
jgi:predicted metalloendopeptidase